MNMQEFAALKEGDAIDNPMSQSSGIVTERKPNGVTVRWGDGTPGKTVTFFYDVQSTSWMHWDLPGRRAECPYCGTEDPDNHKPECAFPKPMEHAA